jgi:hypothetical protein
VERHYTNESNLGLELSRIVEKWLILGVFFSGAMRVFGLKIKNRVLRCNDWAKWARQNFTSNALVG